MNHDARDQDPYFWDVDVEHKLGICQDSPCVNLEISIAGMIAFFITGKYFSVKNCSNLFFFSMTD
jgi:hypothetical protein